MNKGFEDIVYLSGGIEDFGFENPDLIEGKSVPDFHPNAYSKLKRNENTGGKTRVVQSAKVGGKKSENVANAKKGRIAKKKNRRVRSDQTDDY